MAHLVTFRTAKFDPQAEPANPINPIAGHAVLMWIRDALRDAGFEAGEPDAEDWGWYIDVTRNGATYLVGASGEREPGDEDPIEWTIQIDRHRSLTDKLLGRNAQSADDPLTTLIERTVRAAPEITFVEVDRAG